MTSKRLHIVAFDVPFPPNYGGVIDIFYKVKALSQKGIDLVLHCFEYGRGEQEELEKYCSKVHYYKRNLSKTLLVHSSPFIVVSRRDKRLLENLQKDAAPILFEGLHSCFLFSNTALRDRQKYIRAHNIEHHYYRGLAKAAKNLFRRSYFKSEARKLESFESIMKDANGIFAISPLEQEELSKRYENVSLVFPFHGNDEPKNEIAKEDFAFYHGNLSVGENNKAALFLVEKVFRAIPHKLVLAGNNPSLELKQAVSRRENVTLIDNCENDSIFEFIAKAKINILPTFQSTGIKLKLVNALYHGGHILVNSPMVKDTGLEECCVIRNEIAEMRNSIAELMKNPFTEKTLSKRKKLLLEKLSDMNNAQKLIDSIFKAY